MSLLTELKGVAKEPVAINMSLLAELHDSLLSGDSGDIRNALTMHNLNEQVHNLGTSESRIRGKFQ